MRAVEILLGALLGFVIILAVSGWRTNTKNEDPAETTEVKETLTIKGEIIYESLTRGANHRLYFFSKDGEDVYLNRIYGIPSGGGSIGGMRVHGPTPTTFFMKKS